MLAQSKVVKKSGALFGLRSVAVYSLNERGIEIAANSYKYEVTNPQCRTDSLIHDLHLVELRGRLEKTQMLQEYISESALQSCKTFAVSEEFNDFRELNSDAALVLKTRAGTFSAALEMEISAKKLSRYVRKVKDYYVHSNIEAVFYVCGNGGIERAVRQAEAELQAEDEEKIFTCLYERIQSGPLPLPFRNRKNATFGMT